MLFFITSVGAVYFLHKKTQKFIGEQLASESPKKFTGFSHPAPVTDSDKAIDFVLKAASTEDGTALVIEDHDGRALDVESGGERDGLALIFYKSHGQAAQRFSLLLQEDDSFVLEHKKKCLRYSEDTNGFSLGQCNDIKGSAFDLYYEVKAEGERKLENIYNLFRRRKAANTVSDGSYVKLDNPVIMDSLNGNNITDIVFRNGKAVTRTDVDKPFDAHIGHSEIKVRPLRRRLNVHRDAPKSEKKPRRIIHNHRRKKKQISDRKAKIARKIAEEMCDSRDESTSSSFDDDNNDVSVSRRHQKVVKSTARHGVYV